MTLHITDHFMDQADDRLDSYEELASYTYTQLAQGLTTSTTTGTLFNGDTYKVVTLAGITYGIGYTVDGDVMIAKTLLSPYMVEENEKRRMH